jgi:hypothetical protein
MFSALLLVYVVRWRSRVQAEVMGLLFEFCKEVGEEV